MIKFLLNLFFKLPEKIRFLLVGGTNTVVGYAIFVSLHFVFQQFLHYNVILALQYIIGINISYLTMKYFVFQTKGNYRSEYMKTFSSYILIYLLNAFLLFALQKISIHIYVAQLTALCLITIITYLLHKYINYR